MVHGWVLELSELSPVQKSHTSANCKYFSATLSDRIKAAHYISLKPRLWTLTEQRKEDGKSMIIKRKQIQPGNLEITTCS